MISPQRHLKKVTHLHVSLTRSPWLLLAPLLSPTVPQVTSPPCCLCPESVHRFQWIRNLVPEFGVSSSHVRVLSSPAEFFELMKGQIKIAKRRVVMASLYLGTGPLEQELVRLGADGPRSSWSRLHSVTAPDVGVSVVREDSVGGPVRC